MIFFSTLRTLELSLVDLWDLLWSLYCLWVLETKSVPRIVKFKPKCCLVILKSKLLQWTLQLTKVSKFMWISWMKIIQNTLQNCEASQQFSHCTFFILFCRIKIIMLNYFFCARKCNKASIFTIIRVHLWEKLSHFLWIRGRGESFKAQWA